MGYYSNLSLERMESDYDRSCPTPEMQLLWRLDDLYDRLDVLIEDGVSYIGDGHLDDNDIRYAIPSYFQNVYNVERAIELALDELNFQKFVFYSNSKKAPTLLRKKNGQFILNIKENMNTRRCRNDNCSRF